MSPPKRKRPAADEPSHPRLASLDAYRGLIMISLAFAGFGLAGTAAKHLEADPENRIWQIVQYQFTHVQWVGCSFWDLIQPSFMFMVGVSMAYSYAKRTALGFSWGRNFGHALWRSIVLILLGVFLSSNWGGGQTNWSFMNVLSQIGLGYLFLFLLWRTPKAIQIIAALVLLAVTWGFYTCHPGTGIDLETGAPEVGVTAEWARENLEDVDPAWHKNANAGHAVDLEFLNLFPRKEPFEYNGGGYQTINFIPSLVTMLFGLMIGEMLRSGRSRGRKLGILIIAGFAGLAGGIFIDLLGISPLVKRIWTPGFAVFSTGWCCLILGFLYLVIDVWGWKKLAFPLVVVGMNSILMYLMGQLLKPWMRKTLDTHFGDNVFGWLGENWEPFLQANLVGLAFWLFLFWLYRQRIFLRI